MVEWPSWFVQEISTRLVSINPRGTPVYRAVYVRDGPAHRQRQLLIDGTIKDFGHGYDLCINQIPGYAITSLQGLIQDTEPADVHSASCWLAPMMHNPGGSQKVRGPDRRSS